MIEFNIIEGEIIQDGEDETHEGVRIVIQTDLTMIYGAMSEEGLLKMEEWEEKFKKMDTYSQMDVLRLIDGTPHTIILHPKDREES